MGYIARAIFLIFIPQLLMPEEKADVDPADIKGLPLDSKDINQSGEPQGRAALRRGLGLQEEDTTDDENLEEEEEEEEDDDKPPQREKKKDKPDDESGRKKSKKPPEGAEKDPNELGENYESFVQRNAEEAYAVALNRAKNEEDYLAKLVASKDPIDQRLAKKLIEKHDFGAKSVDEYRKNLRNKEIGDDPLKLQLAEMNDRLERMENGSNERSWTQWKKENAVSGKASEIADDIHKRYPDMPEGEVMELVKGKLGGSFRAPQKPSHSTVFGGDGTSQEDSEPVQNARLVKSLLPNYKKTAKFAKKYLQELRR